MDCGRNERYDGRNDRREIERNVEYSANIEGVKWNIIEYNQQLRA